MNPMADHLAVIKTSGTIQEQIRAVQVEIRYHENLDKYSLATAYWKERLAVLINVNMGRIKV